MRRTNSPQTALQSSLVTLIQAAMLERRVGYSKLAAMSGVRRSDIYCCIKQGHRGISIEKLMIMLNQLGYEITIAVRERELTEDEYDYYNARGCTIGKFRPTTIPGKAESSVFQVRLLDRYGRIKQRKSKVLPTAQVTARTEHRNNSALA